MGRVTRSSHRRPRGLADRPFVLFGLLLLVPAVGFGLLGWRSVERERDAHAREIASEARDVVERRLQDVAAGLRTLEARESDRPYYAYQSQFAPEETIFQQLDFQPSPLTKAPEDPRVLGWFQWELGAKGVFSGPEVFGPETAAWAPALGAVYGPALEARLAAAPGSVDLRGARRVDHPLRVVKANEERGQLIEEIQLLQNQQRLAKDESEKKSSYLDTFSRRATDAPVPVRYGAFRYLARPAGLDGPPLVAWRLVWIPGVYAEQREVRRDRWLLQGYALDPGNALPTVWEPVGSVRIVRADLAGSAPAEGRRDDSVASVLGATVLPSGDGVLRPDPRLSLVAVPNQAVIEGAYADARARFLWLLASVVAVVGVGFFVLTRGLRREVALARQKEDFLAAVTHELKTPLAAIRMHADMLREGWVADPDAAVRYASRILDETDRLGHLVDQVLDLAALERGVARAHAVPGDLAACVRDAASLVEARVAARGARLSIETAADLPLVAFDPRLVRPLVLNLLDNALKYGLTDDAREIRVVLSRESDAVLLAVADRGPGIDPSIRRRLFEPFLRAGDEMTRTAPGVGIGLALVKRYAVAHDARIGISSDPGLGTRVEVRFPL